MNPTQTTSRPVTNDDLWSAIRGCGMTSLTKANLEAIIESHKNSPVFAIKVIVEAARQCIAGRLYRKE